ncbi:MAG TPA: Gfo/Idh/MocA family oxidoreductase [Pseudomonadales bacterium]
MTEPLRIAVLSRWHVHADEYAKAVNDHPGAQVAAVWDENAERGAAWATELGVEFVADYAALLARRDIDGVVVTSPTDRHRELIVGAAQAGKHVFTEKVLATRLDDAYAIAAAVRDSSIRFAISFPRRTIAPLVHAKAMLDAGAFGDVTLMRIRIAHDGALRNWLPAHFFDPVACGGGAMIDLGAHGMYLSRWLLGKPRRCTSIFNSVTGRAVEDNAVSVIEFQNNAVAINETSFVSWGGAYSIEIDGSRGGFQMSSPRNVRTRSGDDKTWAPAELPPDEPMPIPRWIASIDGSGPVEFGMGIEQAVELSEMMHAAYRSHAERRTVDFAQLRT